MVLALGVTAAVRAQAGPEPVPAGASSGAIDGVPIAAVELRIDGELESPQILKPLLAVEVGAPLDPSALRRTLRNLHATGLFSKIEALGRQEADRLVVVIHAERLPTVGDVRFVGDLQLLVPRVRRRFQQRNDAPLDPVRMDSGVRETLELYRSRGYFEATVEWRLVPRGRRGRDVVVEVDAGPKATLGAVRIEGDRGPHGEGELVESLRLKSRYDPDRVAAAAERMRLFLVERGHLEASVEPPVEVYDPSRQTLDLFFKVNAGPLYEVETLGVERRWLERRGYLPLEERPLAEPLLQQGCLRLLDDLQGKGHFYARVDCRIEDLTPQGADAAVAATRRLAVEVERGEEYEVASVRFTGNDRVAAAELGPLVRVGPRRRLQPGSGRLMSRELREDVENVRSYYLLQGFLDVEVGPTLIEQEPANKLSVVIPIHEGRRRRVVGVRVEGAEVFEPEALLAKLPLQAGGGYHPLRLEDATNAVRTLYEEEGYPQARVEPELDWGGDGELVEVTLHIDEGEPRTLERLVLRGLQRTRPSLIEAHTGLRPGDPISRRRLLAAERELYRLGIFSEVDVELVPSADDRPERHVRVRLDEGRRWRLSYGLSYHSDDGIGGLLGLSRTNLRGLGERLQLDIRTSENDSRLRLFYDQPMPFGVRLPLTWTLFLRSEERETYEVEESGFRLQMAKDRGPLRLGLIYDYRLVRLEGELFDPNTIDREDREAEISSLAPNILLDRRDDALDPSRGWSLAAQLEYAFPFGSAEANFLKLFAQYTRYQDLWGFGTLAMSLRVGAIEPLGDPVILDPVLPADLASSRIPISERFFAGGRTTHRAYERDRLGIFGQSLIPNDGGTDLFEVGGNGLVLLNLDWRFPISGALGGVAFLDVGNVWADWRDVELGDVRPGLGLGVRYASPVGPVRLEIGWKLDAEDFEEDEPIFLLSFGNPF
ncbi:MAG: POTRA domain-containing protein [Acidobacteriota bacterium]